MAVDSGKLRAILETILPLSEARRAQEISQSGYTRGKIVLKGPAVTLEQTPLLKSDASGWIVLSAVGLLATAFCGLFAGAAVYINLVEHPARMSCGVEAALREWAPSYKRASIMQASLAILGGVTAVLAWALVGRLGYLVGGLLLLAVVPFTLIVIFPTNRLLLELHATGQVGNAHELLRRWNALHAVRSALSVLAFVLMLTSLVRG